MIQDEPYENVCRLAASVMAMKIIVQQCGDMTLLGKRKAINPKLGRVINDERT